MVGYMIVSPVRHFLLPYIFHTAISFLNSNLIHMLILAVSSAPAVQPPPRKIIATRTAIDLCSIPQKLSVLYDITFLGNLASYHLKKTQMQTE